MNLINKIQMQFLLLFCRSDPRQEMLQESQKMLESKGLIDSERFFKRFEGRIDFTGKKVLDVGCGGGQTCVYMVSKGAQSVTGIDIDLDFIQIARRELEKKYSSIQDKVRYCHIDDLTDEKFDLIISKNSFEHIKKPENFLNNYKKHLTPDGHIAIGFGPLWKSPYGPHLTSMTRFPWVHLLFPKEVILELVKRLYGITVIYDERGEPSDLNMMTLKKFNTIINNPDFCCVFLKKNSTKYKFLSITLNIFCLVPFLKEYFTTNIFCVLKVLPQKK